MDIISEIFVRLIALSLLYTVYVAHKEGSLKFYWKSWSRPRTVAIAYTAWRMNILNMIFIVYAMIMLFWGTAYVVDSTSPLFYGHVATGITFVVVTIAQLIADRT